MKLVAGYNISIVLDVGANAGQYGQQLRDLGYRGRMVSFETLSSAYRQLVRNTQDDPLWETFNIAIGNQDGNNEINIAGNSYSSSILQMLPSHVKSAPESRYVSKEPITVRRLDSVLNELNVQNEQIYLKIDTQGYEKNVVAGAGESLGYMSTIQLEMSLVPLYQDELLFCEVVNLLAGKGYVVVSLEPGFSDPATGKLLQVDGIFHRF